MDDQKNEIDLSPCSPSEHHAKALEFKNSGNEKYSNSDFKRAIAEYKKGLIHEPTNSDLHTNLSAAYIHLEKYIEAEEHAVYAIQLRPNFYKGYMRAAKAAHGRSMTRLALKRITAGLAAVTDPNGVKELTRLKTQYTSYLSLESNAEREMSFDSDKYESEDEDDDRYMEDYGSDGEDLLAIPRPSPRLTVEPTPVMPPNKISTPVEAPVPSKDLPKSKVTESSKVVEVSKGVNSTRDQKNLESEKVADTKPTASVSDRNKSTENAVPEKEPDRFLELCKDLTKDPDLSKHVKEFKDHLKTGSEAYLSGNYRKAAESYKAAKERVGIKFSDYEIDDRQYHVIKYVHCAALINLGSYDEIIKALQALTEMETYKFSIPALYIQMAQAYCKLNRFKTALEPLEKLQEIIDNYLIFPSFTWPGTNETIQETTPNGLKSAIKELNQSCRMSHKPSAVCRFDGCLKISTHILPSELIYTSDPDFIGFVRMLCEEDCHIEFHIPCWKSYKESICGIGKINDKDFLGRRCLTTDCVNSGGEPSIIIVIEIIGSDGQVKSVNKLDPKVLIDSIKKAKKRKSEKKDDKEKIITKSKKTKGKKVREVKKPVAIIEEEEEPVESHTRAPVKAIEAHKQSLVELRRINFGLEDKCWNPQLPFYGRTSESVKASNGKFVDYSSSESVPVKDAKEFLFSYFVPILKREGPLKQTEVEDLWKENTVDFCEIPLPNSKSIGDLLIESTRFCQLEDYICLADQLDVAYDRVKNELADTVDFLMKKRTAIDSSQAETIQHTSRKSEFDSHFEPEGAVLSSSKYESESEEDNSGDESEESEEEASDTEDNIHDRPTEVFEMHHATSREDRNVSPEPVNESRDSLKDILEEMARVQNIFMKGSDCIESAHKIENTEKNKIKNESPCNDGTFETAETIDDKENSTNVDKPQSETFTGEPEEGMILNSPGNDESEDTTTPSVEEQGHSVGADNADTPQNNPNVDENKETWCSKENENVLEVDLQEFDNSAECNKASQSEIPTEERHIQTSPTETKDRLSQTKESDLYKELNKKVQDLSNQLSAVNKEHSKLTKELDDKEALCNQLQKDHKALANMLEEYRKNMDELNVLNERLRGEYSKTEAGFKLKEEVLVSNMNKLKDLYTKSLTENNLLKIDNASLLKGTSEIQQSLSTTMEYVKQYESKCRSQEKNMRIQIQKSFVAHLQTIRAYWESQIGSLRKRCIEKISERYSLLSMFPEEVKNLPSLEAIKQNIKQWGDISEKILQLDAKFQMNCTVMEDKIAKGENVDDLSLLLSTLPVEPATLPLDKIHKEITDEHIKKIAELTQLVANQQLAIEKSKESNQQIQQLMNSLHMMPRVQSPMTTAFGGLALQYSYPHSLPLPGGQTTVPTIPPPNSDTANIGTTASSWPDVQTLLQESSKLTNIMNTTSGNQYENPTFKLPITTPPPPIVVPSTATLSMPPPPIGVAHNLLKASAASTNKKDLKHTEKPAAQKAELTKSGSSRETTPVPTTVAPTPEKTKKKKKNKTSENKEASEAKAATPAATEHLVMDVDRDNNSSEWTVVISKGAIPKHAAPPPPTPSESKMSNKKKLLDKLQNRFPKTPVKDLDDIVKLVREQNNGSLSGLPFDEIETRVERFITKRHFQKTSTMGLIKFSEAAWGTVKQPENITTNLQVDECVICFDEMQNNRTKLDCNHAFHTECLRNWLKEKSVCPLCNTFTTMPDEFPAL